MHNIQDNTTIQIPEYLTLYSEKLYFSSNTKMLVICIDDKLSYETHTEHVTKKLASNC